MDWTKIKNFITDHKQYVFAIFIVVVIFILMRPTSRDQDNNIGDFSEEKQVASQTKKEEKNSQDSDTEHEKEAATPKSVTCDISGAVKKEGVYTLKNGARLNELIEVAGGTRTDANLKKVNRALILKDQDKVRIPYKGEKISSDAIVISAGATVSTSDSQRANNENKSNKVNINTGDVQELQKLNGIGEKKAQQIIAYRQKNGQFKSIEDLKQVSGIGDKIFAAVKDQLEV